MKKMAERAEYPLTGVKYAVAIRLKFMGRGGGLHSRSLWELICFARLEQFSLTVEDNDENCFLISTNHFFLFQT